MKFLPLSESDLQVASLLQEGIYGYQVIKSEDKISQAGNEYISMQLKVWDNDGREHLIFTNLALIKLLKHFCDINNLKEMYDAGEVLAEVCLNKSDGKVIIGIEGEKPDGKGGMYRAKNIVKDYVNAPSISMMKPLPNIKDDGLFNDTIPF